MALEVSLSIVTVLARLLVLNSLVFLAVLQTLVSLGRLVMLVILVSTVSLGALVVLVRRRSRSIQSNPPRRPSLYSLPSQSRKTRL